MKLILAFSGVIGLSTGKFYKLQDLTDTIPVVGYRDTAHCDPLVLPHVRMARVQ